MTQPLSCLQEAFAELAEKKSRFLAYLIPVKEFETRLSALKLEHPKANHFVVALRWQDADGHIQTGAKDDGEPSGTSGMPMLKVLTGAGLLDAGIVCVRYFGGTKLGTGGLARAYSGAARLVIDRAVAEGKTGIWDRIVRLVLPLGFSEASRIEQQIPNSQIVVLDRHFTENGVTLILEGPSRKMKQFKQF